MAIKKGSSALIELMLMGINLFNKMIGISQIVHRELRRAGKSILVLIMLSTVFVILLTASWFGLMTLLFLYLTSLHYTVTLVLSIIIGLNLFLMVIVSYKICKIKRKLFSAASLGLHRIRHNS